MPEAPDLNGGGGEHVADLGAGPQASLEATPVACAIEPPQPSSAALGIFFGRDGLRAGWSLLLFAGLLYAILYAYGSILHALHWRPAIQDGLIPPDFSLLEDGLPFLCLAAATWIMAKIERRPTAAFGLGGAHRLRNFLAGLAWGVACLSLLVFALRATGLLVFDARLLSASSALRWGVVWLGGFLCVGLFEEYLCRGYLQLTLARGLCGLFSLLPSSGDRANANRTLGFWTAAAITSFGFGITHTSNPGESPIGLLSAGLIGIVFCLSLWHTGSLWWAIGFHASWDWAQSLLYGVADSGLVIQGRLFRTHPVGSPIYSGGLTGPEGSLFILPTLALIAAIILLTLPRARVEPPH